MVVEREQLTSMASSKQLVLVVERMEMMDEQEEDLGSFSSFDDDDEEAELRKSNPSSSSSSSSSEFIDDATSSCGNSEEEESSLFEMSDLVAQLPFKRGLSKHFQGKSRSFSSLSSAKIVEDLAKPVRPFKKKLKNSKSYGIALESSKGLSCAKAITKKTSRASFSLLGAKKKGFFESSRLPFLSLSSSGDFSGQALMFA